MVASARARDLEQLPLRVVDLLQVSVVGHRLDPRLLALALPLGDLGEALQAASMDRWGRPVRRSW